MSKNEPLRPIISCMAFKHTHTHSQDDFNVMKRATHLSEDGYEEALRLNRIEKEYDNMLSIQCIDGFSKYWRSRVCSE